MTLEPDGGLVVQSSDMALLNVASLASTGALDLSPRFQRRNRWDRDRQSALIESFILNIPVPPVYLAEEARGVFAVIDGKQRLTAITQFLSNEFPLRKLSFRPELDGLAFEDLDASLSSTLSMRPIRAVMILRESQDWVKHEVFTRLNTGGQPLNAQELRNVAFAGEFNDRIIKLSSDPFLRQQLKIESDRSNAYAQMADVEAVVRFLAMAEAWKTFSGSTRGTLDNFMLTRKNATPTEIDKFASRFERAMHWCEILWRTHAFRRYDGEVWRDQFLNAMYDAQTIAVDSLPDRVLDSIDPERSIALIRDLFGDPIFEDSVRISTNTPSKVAYRVTVLTDGLRDLA